MHLAMEVLMFTGLCGGLLMAAVLIVIDVLRTRKLLLKMDLSEVLVNAQNKLDDPIRERLSDGTILLLRTDWLMSPASDAQLGKDPLTGKPIIKRRQEMPPEAYFSPAASVRPLARNEPPLSANCWIAISGWFNS